MSRVTLICLCVLVGALAVIIRIHNFEQGLARAAYASCSSKEGSLLNLVGADSASAP